MNAPYLLLGLLCGLAIGYAFGWQYQRKVRALRFPIERMAGWSDARYIAELEDVVRVLRREREVVDCAGGIRCSTCPGKNRCKTGCYRQEEYTERPGRNELPNGLTLVQQNPDCAVDLRGGSTHGWLYTRSPGGEWVTQRKLEPWEVMQAEDQQVYGIVQHGTQVRAG